MVDKEQVISALRATLISVKGAITIKQCNRDYRELQGEWIPFKKLGYSSLDQLFLEVPGFKVKQVNNEWYVDAIASQETQHIASMVSRQKSNKKGPTKLNYLNRFPKSQGSWRKPASHVNSSNYNSNQSKFKPSYNNNVKYNNKNDYYKNSSNEAKTNYNAKPIKNASEVNEKQSKANSNYSSRSNKEFIKLTEELKYPVKSEHAESHKPTKTSASQRLSNLRDGIKNVDVIPLQLPNSNDCSEPMGLISHVAPAHSLEPPPESTSSVAKLEWTCRKLGLPQPVYNVQDMRPKKGPVSYDCTVKVATYFSSSYPQSSPSEDLAKEVAAIKLLQKIEDSEAEGLPTSSNSKCVLGLADLVADHDAGLWASTVPHLYRVKYKENLPSNWQELIENCPRIVTDKVVNGLLVLLPNVEEPYKRPTVLSDDTIDSDLPALVLPDDNFWNVFIMVANSTLEIWLRIIGPEYSGAFEDLLVEMADYYEHSGTVVDKSMIIDNAWYAINLDEGGWQRAKILEINDSETATVFLGDHGDDDIVNLDNIKILEPQFRKLPAQAVLCRLEGAEELAASELGSELTRKRLAGEVLVAAPGAYDPHDPARPVVLYDTSTVRDLNLNKEIVHDFCIAGAFTITQKPCEVEVGCVSEEGRVWVRRAGSSGGAAAVRAALALLTSGPHRRPLPAAPVPPLPIAPTLYIVRTLAGEWVRCAIISGLDGEGTVRTQLVDSGLVLRAPLSSLVPLHAFSAVLDAYPRQAIQVRLGATERAVVSMASRLRELLLDARVLCRTLPATSPAPSAGGPPNVELFVRTGPQNILVSVNNSVLMEYEYLHHSPHTTPKEEDKESTGSKTVEALNRKKERIFRSTSGGFAAATSCAGSDERSGGALPLAPLPPVGKCLDVHVAMAANPWNFVVQPNSTRHALLTMMATLQAECPKISETEAPASPSSGELFTVFYDKDDSWYRVTIAGAVSTEMVSVYFCDYGDLALFSSSALRPVPAAAPLARSLPPQAIKARLFNVLPLHQDWTVEDCIRFQELCVEQQFVGVCKEVSKDPLNPSEPLLTLDLIDTSTDEDVYLNNQLVAEGRARLLSDS